MRDSTSFLCLVGILLLSTKACNALCKLENGTMARCHDLEDAKYIDTYDLEILTTSVRESRLGGEIFHNLVSLRNLDLSHGDIELIEPETFRELIHLQNLDLSHNKISSVPSTLFDGLTELLNLNVRRNSFTEIPEAVLRVKSLKNVDLTGNPIDCTCSTLKNRDVLLARGVHLSKRILCASPPNLKSKQLLKVDVQTICLRDRFEEQDKEMQMDQPENEGSGEVSPDDPFDDPTVDEFSEEKHDVTHEESATPKKEEIETPAPAEHSQPEESVLSEAESSNGLVSVPSTTEASLETSRTSDETILSEENDKHILTLTTSSTESAEGIEDSPEEKSKKLLLKLSESENEHPQTVEGSGEEEELQEGSGIEGSGTGVPPISWDVPDDDTIQETSSSEPSKTTDPGLLDMLWGVLWSTSAAPEEEKKKELRPEDEEFINVSSEGTPIATTKTPAKEEVIVPAVASDREGSLGKKVQEDKGQETVVVGKVLDDAKSGKVKVDDSTDAEATDASATRQPKKGMGSYVVLAALLVVLGVLIGFAAYKGDFCRKRRKRNDPERGTELRDMTKALLDSGNAPQPKISSNGNLENVPLVSTPPQDDSKTRNSKSEPITETPDVSKTRYSGVPPDVIDPIKPPRKSYTPHDETDGVKTNGTSQQGLEKSTTPVLETTEPVCLRNKAYGDSAINGKNHHDSVSSLGTHESIGSPSVRTSPRIPSPTNGSLGNFQGLVRPPLSPGAQRVKITLQENPDSVPKTPILITRTKAGENLVKTP